MKQMQTGNPDKLILLHLTHGGKNLEDELHHNFSKHHFRGEWFRPAKELIDYIEEIKKEKTEPRVPFSKN